MSSEFAVEIVQRNSPVTILRLQGRLEAAGAQELLEKATALKDEGDKILILVLRDVEFLASSGLGTLLLLTEEFRDVGGRMSLADLPPAVQEVITLLNLDQFLTIEPSVESKNEHVVS